MSIVVVIDLPLKNILDSTPFFNKFEIEKVLSKLSYNHFHNILRLFDVLLNFGFTTSETMCDYYL